jgi:hypothetical protein
LPKEDFLAQLHELIDNSGQYERYSKWLRAKFAGTIASSDESEGLEQA